MEAEMLELAKDQPYRASGAKREFSTAEEFPEEDRFLPMAEIMRILDFKRSESVYNLAKRKTNPLKLIRPNSRVTGVRVGELRRFLRELEDAQRA
jgi:hypothetical protein